MITEYQFQAADGRVVDSWVRDCEDAHEALYDTYVLKSPGWKMFQEKNPGAKLVRVLKESEAEANKARLDYLDAAGPIVWQASRGIRVCIDDARNAPQPKITVISDSGKDGK